MKITFETSGGFVYLPALSKPVTIDTAKIDPQVAKQLETFVRESRFFDQPTRIDPLSEDKPTAFTVEGPNSQHVIFRGTDGRIHEIRWT